MHLFQGLQIVSKEKGIIDTKTNGVPNKFLIDIELLLAGLNKYIFRIRC